MRFKNYALTLFAVLGLGATAFAQSDWGVPTGTTGAVSPNNDKNRYVTSVTTVGANPELSYSNGSLPSSVFVDTGASFTVEQGQEFQLHVTTSNDMKWCHGVIYADWNGDNDFDDEGEMIKKVGYDSSDEGLPSNFGGATGVGNSSYILDFTETITVPENAVAGETRLRLQFQDAWHGTGPGHQHTAMDVIDKGGVYDFVMNVAEAEVPEPQPGQGEWEEIYNEPLAWNSPYGYQNQENLTYTDEFYGASSDMVDGYSHCLSSYPFTSEYMYLTYNVPEDGKYKFSYLVSAEGFYGSTSVKMNFIHGTGDSYEVFGETADVAGGYSPTPVLIMSEELELTAGEHNFGLTFAEDNYDVTIYIADFRLYQLKASEPAPTLYPVTLQTTGDGTLTVMNGDVAVNSGDEVAAGTELVITAEPADGYVLETLTVNGADFTSGETYITTEEETVIAATFAAAPVSDLTAINLPAASGSTQTLFVFDEDDYGQGAQGNFYNNRSGNLTMSVWVNIHEANGFLFGYGQQWYAPDGVFRVGFSNGKFTLWNRYANESHTDCKGDDGSYPIVSEQAVELDTWAFVTVVYDTDNLKRYMYYNGEEVINEPIGMYGLGLLPDDCVFFVNNPKSSQTGNLDLDEVQLWNRALSADEVKASMTNVDPAAQGLISLYRFGEDRMGSDNRFANLAEAGTVAAKVISGWGSANGGNLPSTIIAPTFVEGRPAVVEPEPEPEPGEGSWVAVYSNDYSGTTTLEVDVTNMSKLSYTGTITGVEIIEAKNADGAVLEGQPYSVAWYWPSAYEAHFVTLDIEEAGKYKFSMRGRFESSKSGNFVDVDLRYGDSSTAPGDMTVASAEKRFTNSVELPGELMESSELDLQPGTYRFCIYMTNAQTSSGDYLFIGDFNLYKYEEGAVPTTYTVTWATPENGTLTVTAADEALTSPATVAAGTDVVITATPAEGYVLETLTVNEADFENDGTYTVNEDVVVAATFAAAPVQTWAEPTGTVKAERYATSASTTGAAEDLSYTAASAPDGLYVNTQLGMTVEQGQSFDLSMQATEDTKFAHVIVYVDWNRNYSFDDEGEQLFKVGMDSYEETELPYLDNQGNPSSQGTIQNPEHISAKGNPEAIDFTRTIEVPADAALGTTRMRVIYTDAWHGGTADDPKHLSTDNVDKGRVYDFDVTITEATVPADVLLTIEAENCTVTVRDYDSLDAYENNTRIPVGTKLLISAKANEGYTNATVTVNDQPWEAYEAWTVKEGEDIHVKATAESLKYCLVNYSFEGDEFGSIKVTATDGYSMLTLLPGNDTYVAVGEKVNVTVTMNNENAEGTITYGDESEDFNYADWYGEYTKSIKIEEDMTELEISVVLREGEPAKKFNVEFSITNPDLAEEYHLMDGNGDDLVVGTNQVTEGTELGLMVLFESNEEVRGVVKVDGVKVDEFDFESCQGVYYGTVVESVDKDLKVEVELTDEEVVEHLVTYSLTGDAAGAAKIFVNEFVAPYASVESGSTVADGTPLQFQITYEDQSVQGTLSVNGEKVDEFDWASCTGVYTYSVEALTADINVVFELTYGNGLGGNTIDGVAVYPTVFTENVTVQVPADGRVTVYDLSGAAVYTTEVVEGNNVLGLGSLANGLYIVKVENQGDVKTIQVMKK